MSLDGVIVDGASTDETVAIAQGWLDSLNLSKPWPVLVQSDNRGQATARNRGAQATQGQILCFCDDDDVYRPHHFRLIYEGFQTVLPLAAPFLVDTPSDRPATVTTGIYFGDPIHPEWKQALEGTMIQNRGIRRSLHNFIGGFPENDCFRSGTEDLAYVRWAENFGRRHHIPRETLEYHRYPDSHFDRQLKKFQRSPNLEHLANDLQRSPQDLALNQARTEAYTRRHHHLVASFQQQWLSRMDNARVD